MLTIVSVVCILSGNEVFVMFGCFWVCCFECFVAV